MKHQEFIEYLTHPQILGDASLTSLHKVVDKFPYFQTAHLLFAKNLHNQNNIHYNEQLKIAAIYASDRTALYNLIFDQTENVPYNASEAEIKKESIPTASEKEIMPLTEQKLSEKESAQIILHSETYSLEKQVALDTTIKTPTPIEELKVDISSIIPSLPLETENLPIEVKKASTHNDSPKEKTKTDRLSGVENPNVETPLQTEPLTPSELLFSDWLLKEKVVIIDEKKISTHTEVPLNANPDKKQLNGKDLIDLFIKSEPKIIPSKAEFYSPAIKAKESLKEHDDFVSETLAKIYAKQGNIAKAVQVYEKLSLKYPEKSSYFAERIKKLKDSQPL